MKIKVTEAQARYGIAYKYQCHLCKWGPLFGSNFVKHLVERHEFSGPEARSTLMIAARNHERKAT